MDLFLIRNCLISLSITNITKLLFFFYFLCDNVNIFSRKNVFYYFNLYFNIILSRWDFKKSDFICENNNDLNI